MRTTDEILEAIGNVAGDGSCPQGFDLFESSEVLENKDLHANYDYCAAVRYLMKIRPEDAERIAVETNVEL